MSHHPSVAVFGRYHIGFLPRSLPRQLKQLPAVKEVVVAERRQVLLVGDDGGFQLAHIALFAVMSVPLERPPTFLVVALPLVFVGTFVRRTLTGFAQQVIPGFVVAHHAVDGAPVRQSADVAIVNPDVNGR